MKINSAIHSVDDNKYYTDFWPIVSKIWKLKFNIHPILIHITDDDELDLTEEFGSVIKIKKLDNIPGHIQAQIARFWYPQFAPDATWITSDIDMFPISINHFIDHVDRYPDDSWVNLNSNEDYFPVCYNVAKGFMFKQVLNLCDDWEEFLENIRIDLNIDDWNNNTQSLLLHEMENQNNTFANWGFDEVYISKHLNHYRNTGGEVYTPVRPDGFPNGRRIDRSSWHYQSEMFLNDFYIDCHSLRPYHVYKNEIDKLVELILPNQKIGNDL
jgi:hypothetical protein